METIIVTGQATTDAQSGAAGTSNMIVIPDAPKIRDIISAKIVSPHNSDNQVGHVGTAATSGFVNSFALSGVLVANLYPVPRASLGSGVVSSGQIAICSGVTASGATVQITTTSSTLVTGTELGINQQLILKVSTRGEIVRT